MLFIIGIVVVFGSVLGGYLPHGNILVLFQPFEFLIILGGALGGLIIATPMPVLKLLAKRVGNIFKTQPYSRDSYLELLTLLYSVFRLAKTKGALALESHIDNPFESPLFNNYPNFAANHHAVEFISDYLRLLTMGTENPYQMEDLMNEELETHHEEISAPANAIITMGDALPALGIVAAVLGVIVTMGSITEPPEVLGQLIGAALVGTFFGILMSYGVVSPMGQNMAAYANAETQYYECIKAGLLAHLQGYAPAVSVEFARKMLNSDVRPSFYEVEEAVAAAPSV